MLLRRVNHSSSTNGNSTTRRKIVSVDPDCQYCSALRFGGDGRFVTEAICARDSDECQRPKSRCDNLTSVELNFIFAAELWQQRDATATVTKMITVGRTSRRTRFEKFRPDRTSVSVLATVLPADKPARIVPESRAAGTVDSSGLHYPALHR